MITNFMFVVGITIGLDRVAGPFYGLLGLADATGFMAGLMVVAVLVRRRGSLSFNLIKRFYAVRCVSGVRALVFNVLKAILSRDLFAFAFAVLALGGLSWTIPWFFGAAAIVWLGFIAGAVPSLMSDPSTETVRPRPLAADRPKVGGATP
jgi:CDP-L-myo-inositol myo-inositolphosphotransferase